MPNQPEYIPWGKRLRRNLILSAWVFVAFVVIMLILTLISPYR